MSNYDAWLEQPYRDRARQDAFAEQAVEQFSEAFDIALENVDEAEAVQWYEEGLAAAAEDAAIAAAEDAAFYDDYDY